MDTKKLISAAKFMNTGTKVVGGIFGAVSIVCAVFAVLLAIMGQQTFEAGSFTLELGYITLDLAGDFPVDMVMMKWFACVGLVGLAVMCFLVMRACFHLCAILTPMEEGRPFEPDAPGSLRKIAWITLIGGAVFQILLITEGLFLTRIYPMDAIFTSDAIEKIEYTFTFDHSFVWIACLILFLSYIFSYGQALQREADETL